MVGFDDLEGLSQPNLLYDSINYFSLENSERELNFHVSLDAQRYLNYKSCTQRALRSCLAGRPDPLLPQLSKRAEPGFSFINEL